MKQIISNHHWHNFLYGYELTEKEKLDFDYMDEDTISSNSFLRYRNCVYALSDFMCGNENDLKGWHGYTAELWFSGTLIKVSDDGEQYQIGTYVSN